MASSGTLYSLPLPTPFQPATTASRTRKRKRKRLLEEAASMQGDLPSDAKATNAEYSAVIRPEERVQRRLAGQPLNEPPPSFPFPHTQLAHFDDAEDTRDETPTKAPVDLPSSRVELKSFRLQHLAAMTALLHRCLEARDYERASRAIALILRTEIHGKTIDLRHGGLWAIAAEVLLRTPGSRRQERIAKEGFEKAKTFYDRMALQYPWHRTWPNAINAQDFKLAMFGLWVYETCEEGQRMQETEDDADSTSANGMDEHELAAKKWELAEVAKISRAMDSLMGTVPFIDHLELIRLRGMVALWTADLHDAVDSLGADQVSDQSIQHQATELAWIENLTDMNEKDMSPKQENPKATDARNLARAMFARLNRSSDDTVSDTDDGMKDPMSLA